MLAHVSVWSKTAQPGRQGPTLQKKNPSHQRFSFFLKPSVCHNITLRASPTARNSAFPISTLTLHSASSSFPPKSFSTIRGFLILFCYYSGSDFGLGSDELCCGRVKMVFAWRLNSAVESVVREELVSGDLFQIR